MKRDQVVDTYQQAFEEWNRDPRGTGYDRFRDLLGDRIIALYNNEDLRRHRGSLAHDLRIAATEVSDATRAERLRTLAEWLDSTP